MPPCISTGRIEPCLFCYFLCRGQVVDLENTEIKPDYYQAYITRGIWYELQGQYNETIKNFTKAIELNPNNAEVYFEHALCYERLGLYDKAIMDLNKAVEIDSNNTLVNYARERVIALVKSKMENR